MVYFSSDMHFGHRSVISMQNRPFASVDDMNYTIIKNFNNAISNEDTVYLVGDICYRISVAEANEIIAQLNGKKILVRGNHDKQYSRSLFYEICDFKVIAVNGYQFILMHYPMLSWPKMRWGSIQVHGHIHSDGRYNIENRNNGIKRFDAGVDANQYRPVSAEQIITFFNPADA